MSPIKRYLDWFEELSPMERSTIALAVGGMLVGVMPGHAFAKEPALFSAHLRSIAERGDLEEAGLALSLVGITNFHIAETPMKAFLEDIGEMRERGIEEARRRGDLAMVEVLEKAAETAPLRDRRMEKMASDWIEMRDRYLTVAAVKAWLNAVTKG
jgi:hypothetical protein